MEEVLDRANTILEHARFGWRGRHRLKHVDPEFFEDDEDDEDDEGEESEESGSGWALFLWGAVTALALWWLYLRPAMAERRLRKVNTLRPAERPGRPPGSRPASANQQSRAQTSTPITEAEPVEVRRDDLTLIWGIGPARAARLVEVGITTFAALAVADTEQLRDILAGVGVETPEMDTWPEQASLAAKGDWQGLEALQDRIRAERA
jgi:predicted flap endonuclease-1-like 5' DNA nuclease